MGKIMKKATRKRSQYPGRGGIGQENRGRYALRILLLIFGLFSLAASGSETTSSLLNLADCIELAVRNNPSLAAYAQHVDEARASASEARGNLLPSLSASGGYDRYSGDGLWDRNESYSVGLQLNQTLFHGGQLLNSLSGAMHGVRAAEYDYETALQDLVLDVRTTYYRLLQRERLTDVARTAVEQAQTHLELAQERFRVGLVRRADVLKSEVELSDATLALIQARSSESLSRGTLNTLLGLPVDRATEVLDILEELDASMDTLSLDVLVRRAEKSRPEVARLTEQIEAQRAQVNVALGEFLPTISAHASYGLDAGSSSDWDSDWSVGLSLNLALFDGLSRKARVSGRRAQLDALLKTREGLLQSVALSVFEARLSVQDSWERIHSTEVQVRSTLENLEMTEAEYLSGVSSMLELVDAQTEYIQAREDYVSALTDLWIARADLDRSMGSLSGFEEIERR